MSTPFGGRSCEGTGRLRYSIRSELLNNRPDWVWILNENHRSSMGLKCIDVLMRVGRVRWFNHVRRTDGSRSKGVRRVIKGVCNSRVGE